MNIIIYTRWFLSILLILSGTGKLIDSEGAEKLLVLLFTLPYNLLFTKLIIYTISILELALALYLLLDKSIRSIIISIILFSIFTFFLLSFVVLNISVPNCGCFGSILPNGSILFAIIRNLLLIFLALYSIYLKNKYNSDNFAKS